MKRVLVTGANRGIGLEWVRQYVERGEQVFAGCRRPETADKLQALAAKYPDHLTVVALDVRSAESIAASYAQVSAQIEALDLLINNAAVYNAPEGDQPNMGDDDTPQMLGSLTFDAALAVLRVNTVAPMMITQQYVEMLKRGLSPAVVNLSSWMASLSGKTSGGAYYYSTSKAALNMVTRALAADLRRFGITVLSIDPGWVKTDMAGKDAELTPEESVAGMMALIDRLTPAHNGGFYEYSGVLHPW
jgi:NAD(P)-dependent dehydrogenase (short-subunit alcohol dehydrogenase family)